MFDPPTVPVPLSREELHRRVESVRAEIADVRRLQGIKSALALKLADRIDQHEAEVVVLERIAERHERALQMFDTAAQAAKAVVAQVRGVPVALTTRGTPYKRHYSPEGLEAMRANGRRRGKRLRRSTAGQPELEFESASTVDVPEPTLKTGELIRSAREAQKMTVEELAEAAKLSTQTIEAIEGNTGTGIGPGVFLRLARALDRHPLLLYGSDRCFSKGHSLPKAYTAQNVRRFRYELGLTQRVLAERAGPGNSTVARLERRGERDPDALAKVATALNRTVAQLRAKPWGVPQVEEVPDVPTPSATLTGTVLSQTLDSVKWTARARNSFQRMGLKTMADLVKQCPEGLLRWPNFGAVSLAEVEAKLSAMGLALQPDS